MLIKVKKNNLGYNGACANCGKIQSGLAKQPLIVYWKDENETRGHNEIICSLECAQEYKLYLNEIESK